MPSASEKLTFGGLLSEETDLQKGCPETSHLVCKPQPGGVEHVVRSSAASL